MPEQKTEPAVALAEVATTQLVKPAAAELALGFKFYVGAEPSSLKEVAGLRDFPDPDGKRDKLETTDQSSKGDKTYTLGMRDHGDMGFKFVKRGTNKADLKKLEGTINFYKFVDPDGNGYQWYGMHDVSEEGKGAGELREFTVTCVNETPFEAVTAAP